jgi:hypothetical protein
MLLEAGDPYYQRHIVSTPRILAATDDEIHVETNYLVIRTKRDLGHGTATLGPVAVPDFFGLCSAEDLCGDFKALFALQNGFKSNTGQGTIAGEAFSHFAWVGLSSSRFGALTLGRQ